jgi:serine/threonine protein phosphatase PrpC
MDEDLAMKPYAAAQLLGDRDVQCDATAVCTAPGTRAYALLDGIGDTTAVRAWTRTAARRLARAAAVHADAEAGLRAERDHYAAAPARAAHHGLPAAAAVVAVHVPGSLLSVAWSGDARAYLLLDGHLRLLTEDHNERRAYEGGDRNLITACLGGGDDDQQAERLWGHPAIEFVRGPARPAWLLLTSDGAYEPHEDADHDLTGYLAGDPREAAERLVEDAVCRARALPDSNADNATALIARLDAEHEELRPALRDPTR